jgi:hypothetical protein
MPFVQTLRQHKRGAEVKLGLVGMRVREHTRANEQLHHYLATLPVPVVGWLRDTQNYVQLAARGLTLWDVAPAASSATWSSGRRWSTGCAPMKHLPASGRPAFLVGQEIGVSDWLLVDQHRIDLFAQATGDHQWIHTDPCAPRTAPSAPPVAHGFLTLSLLPQLFEAAFDIDDVRMGVNYGLNRCASWPRCAWAAGCAGASSCWPSSRCPAARNWSPRPRWS